MQPHDETAGDQPFGDKPEARLTYLDVGREEILAQLFTRIGEGDTWFLVHGGQSVGKTSFLLCVAEAVRLSEGMEVIGDGPLGANPADGDGGAARLLEGCAQGPAAAGSTRVLLLDDADRLDKHTLRELWRHLSELKPEHGRLCVAMTAAPPAKNQRPATEPDLMTSAQRTYRLQPVDAGEVEALVRYRLDAAGWAAEQPFTPEALERIAYFGKGLPGRIVQLCARSLDLSRQRALYPVPADLVKEAAYELFLPGHLQKLARGLAGHTAPPPAEPAGSPDRAAAGPDAEASTPSAAGSPPQGLANGHDRSRAPWPTERARTDDDGPRGAPVPTTSLAPMAPADDRWMGRRPGPRRGRVAAVAAVGLVVMAAALAWSMRDRGNVVQDLAGAAPPARDQHQTQGGRVDGADREQATPAIETPAVLGSEPPQPRSVTVSGTPPASDATPERPAASLAGTSPQPQLTAPPRAQATAPNEATANETTAGQTVTVAANDADDTDEAMPARVRKAFGRDRGSAEDDAVATAAAPPPTGAEEPTSIETLIDESAADQGPPTTEPQTTAATEVAAVDPASPTVQTPASSADEPAASPRPPQSAQPEARRPDERPSAAVPAPRSAAARNSIAQVQTMLRQLGYSPGPIDGILGRRTRAAIRAFQRDERQPRDGRISNGLIVALQQRLNSGTVQPQGGQRSFLQALGFRLDSVREPEAFRRYCENNPDSHVYDNGTARFVLCARALAATERQ